MRPTVLMLSLFVGLTPALHGDDGAASIAAGGIIVMKRETRIVMAKEVLTISPSRIVVDYDFRNDSDEDITTAVAFPIPAYVDDPDGPRWQLAGFDDFKLWVNGTRAKYSVESRAFAGKREITHLLANLGIDSGSFGHQRPNKQQNTVNDLSRLSKQQRERLFAVKAIETVDTPEPNWSVEKKYYWTQTFPAHALVHIRHQYTPVLGNSNTIGDMDKFDPKSEQDAELASLCPTPTLVEALKRSGNTDKDAVGLAYVDFILTTANTWKTPIEDFTLNVERVPTPGYKVNFVSFCWDGPVEKVDANHFTAHINALIPKKELRIGFIQSDWTIKHVKENKQ